MRSDCDGKLLEFWRSCAIIGPTSNFLSYLKHIVNLLLALIWHDNPRNLPVHEKKDTRRKYLKNLSTQNQLLLFEAKVFVQTVRYMIDCRKRKDRSNAIAICSAELPVSQGSSLICEQLLKKSCQYCLAETNVFKSQQLFFRWDEKSQPAMNLFVNNTVWNFPSWENETNFFLSVFAVRTHNEYFLTVQRGNFEELRNLKTTVEVNLAPLPKGE